MNPQNIDKAENQSADHRRASVVSTMTIKKQMQNMNAYTDTEGFQPGGFMPPS